MENDISRNTIFVLIVLTLLISVLGTWTVISQIDAGPANAGSARSPVDRGEVTFGIIDPSEQVVISADATGRVAFEITEP